MRSLQRIWFRFGWSTGWAIQRRLEQLYEAHARYQERKMTHQMQEEARHS